MKRHDLIVLRKEQLRLLLLLAEKGILAPGTILEVVPGALPPYAASRDSRAFRARVGDPRKPRSLVWEFDERSYSPTELTCKLWVEFGVASLKPSYYSHWRILGHMKSLWDESKDLHH